MDFVNKNFSGMFKIAIGIIVFVLFIRILPWVALIGLVLWAFSKVIKKIKSWKNQKNIKEETFERNSTIYDEKDEFDLSEKKIVDVDYKEV
ncbi:hypothetical protein Ccar_07760 [Clostridium carboxidivorans P7]|uniref:Uncharacterized protein n=1 Tax=Clostridium carboxidivorans P7 TaxID=536227 RepID=C6PV88_9CLOT|nr:hypothetical protein [Clostridium carboxidivorans]AKN30736.1 hypothetical protein Ccar_07760 [Clostridium carboxidivorans P7]EET86818.1 conserved hypothetical protein [Clostridium carboxidivorans P7]EFG88562.1 hypothetical protein CLCAR_1784 [Clostridium carboxidivorans P7]